MVRVTNNNYKIISLKNKFAYKSYYVFTIIKYCKLFKKIFKYFSESIKILVDKFFIIKSVSVSFDAYFF